MTPYVRDWWIYSYISICKYICLYTCIYIYIHQQLQLVKARESESQSGEVTMVPGCGCEGPANCLKLDDEYGQAM
jgi:hypothetical protein